MEAGSDDICDCNRINIHRFTCASVYLFPVCVCVSLFLSLARYLFRHSLWIPFGQEMEDARRLISGREKETHRERR